MQVPLHRLVALVAAVYLMALPVSADTGMRLNELEAAPFHRQAELEQRAAQTRFWDSTAESLAEIEAAQLPQGDIQPMLGFEGTREGDMDQVLRTFSAEPGVARWFLGYGGRGTEARAFAVSQTVNGRVLMVGQVGTPDSGGLPTRIGIVQFAHDGTLDASFNATGLQTFDFANPKLEVVAGFGFTETLHSVFYDRVYLLARDFELPGGETFALICLRRPSASSAFEACPNFTSGIRYYALGLADTCASDDSVAGGMYLHRADPPRIFMVGSTRRTFNACADFDWAVLKVGTDGTLDTGFGGTGQVAYWVPNAQPVDVARARSAAVRALGSFVVVGGSTGTGTGELAIVAQFNPTGSIDGGFCAAADPECPSPAAHRNGRRSWNSEATGRVTAIAPTLGEGVYTVRRVGADAATQTYGAISRVDELGRCQFFCENVLMVPTEFRFEPVAAHWRTRTFGFDLTVAGWGHDLADATRNRAYVYRFRDAGLSLDVDAQFVTRSDVPWRQDVDWPIVGGSSPRDARVFGMSIDRQGRILIAGTSRAVDAEYDMSIARLQGRLALFANGFE
jgi:uncharacterized delta-60 repeat protein